MTVGLVSLFNNPYADGASGAPSGTAQFPTILNGYAVRPPWKVAGVEYAVGIPTGTTLKDPGTAGIPAGLSVNTSTHVMSTTADNVVIDGWDFSLDGGWQLLINNNGVTVQNCHFVVGANGYQPINSNGADRVNFTMKYCIVDGASTLNSVGGGGLSGVAGSGTFVYQYNWFKNGWFEGIQHGLDTDGTVTLFDCRFNIIENMGQGFIPAGAHGDWIQLSSGSGTKSYSNVIIDFNLCLGTSTQANTQGFSILSAGGNVMTWDAGDVSYNTVVVTALSGGNGSVNKAFILDSTFLNGSATFNNNFVDPTDCFAGTGGQLWNETTAPLVWANVGSINGTPGPYRGTISYSGNICMLDGTTLLPDTSIA